MAGGEAAQADSRNGGQTSSQTFSAMKHRVWNRQPGGGASGLGISPRSTIFSRVAPPIIGTADSRLRVYGCRGVPNISSAGETSISFPRYITATTSLT